MLCQLMNEHHGSMDVCQLDPDVARGDHLGACRAREVKQACTNSSCK